MRRRRFLAVATAGLSAATAGCNVPGRTTELASPEEEPDAGGREKHLVFTEDGRRVAVFTIQQGYRPESPTDPVELRFHLSLGSILQDNERSTTVEKVRFDLRTPAAANRVPADIYLNVPGSGLAERVRVAAVDTNWTRIAIDDAGPFGEGTISLETMVSPVGDPVEEIRVRTAATLSESGLTGTTYQLDADTRFSPVIRS